MRKIIEEVKERFGDAVESEAYEEGKIAKIVVKPERVVEVAQFLSERGFDHVKSVTGIDLIELKEGGGDFIEVMYQLGSYSFKAFKDVILNVSIKLDRGEPRTPSLCDVWPSAEYHEREVYEMFGVVFEGHPNLKHLLLPEYWMDIPPLRKDYKVPGRD